MSAVPASVIAVTVTEKSDSCQVRVSRACIVWSPSRENRASSCRSLVKLLTAATEDRISNARLMSVASSAFTRSARSVIVPA